MQVGFRLSGIICPSNWLQMGQGIFRQQFPQIHTLWQQLEGEVWRSSGGINVGLGSGGTGLNKELY